MATATTPQDGRGEMLFERPSFRLPGGQAPGGASGTATMVTPTVAAPLAAGSLFDRYAAENGAAAPRRFLEGNGSTLTSRLRASGTKLACYLNTECNRGRSYIIQLPESCDTLGEVFPLVQRKMGLDGRMLYAAELFLPDGQKISSMKQLREAAEIDTAIIVGCGEPFDTSTVPQSMLSFHVHGGGRVAPKVVKKEMAEKKMRAAQLKADQVRASGHGLGSQAALAARIANVETNRQSAAEMRHEYMNQLLARSQQQTELIRSVQANNARLRTDRARREQAKRSIWSEGRLQDLAETRRNESNVFRERHEQEEQRYAKIQTQARAVRAGRDQGARIAKTQLSEQRKAAGLERRMSHISHSVEKAEREQRLVISHQEKLQERRNSLMSHRGRSPLSSQASNFF